MRPSLRSVLAAAVVVAAVVAAAWLQPGATGDVGDRPAFDRAHSAFDFDHARVFSKFPLYAPGESFEGLPLRALTRRDDAPVAGEKIRANYVGFVYGDCVASGENGCPPPVEVQVWPACARSLADYALTPSGEPLPHEASMVRGVPAAYFEDGLRLELYTGDVTVVVFGLDRSHVDRAAAALRPVNALASPARLLPPPAAGALAGTLTCGS
jgi:hypothetical protein